MKKMIIKEVIVVEGKDDISAIKNAVDAELIAVHGFSVRKGSNLDKLEMAYKNKGLIVFTDPDYAGEQIRRTINKRYPNSKNAYITEEEGRKIDNIGVENASPEAIIRALKVARVEIVDIIVEEFQIGDLIEAGLIGKEDSANKREQLGKELSLGYSNGKQLLSKLNRYGIRKEEFNEALIKINKN
ncbi:MAG: ribonuclease M5 [Fusobacteriaceae bacterium]